MQKLREVVGAVLTAMVVGFLIFATAYIIGSGVPPGQPLESPSRSTTP